MGEDKKSDELISTGGKDNAHEDTHSNNNNNNNNSVDPIITESIVTPQQNDSSNNINTNNNNKTPTLLPKSLPKNKNSILTTNKLVSFSQPTLGTKDPTPNPSKRGNHQSDDDESEPSSRQEGLTYTKVPGEEEPYSNLSNRVRCFMRCILGSNNYSDMNPIVQRPVVNASSPSCSTYAPPNPLKRPRNSESLCDCEEETCQCGEEDSYFDWVWDEDSKSSACHLKQDHREVIFHMDYSCGTAAVRGTGSMKENQHYWEVKMMSTVYGTDMMVGVSTVNIDLNKYRHAFCSLLGRDEDSWGLSYTGVTYHKAKKALYTSKFSQGDIIGVHLDMWLGTMSYYKNKRPLGIAYRGLQGKSLYPVVSSTAARSGMKVVKCRSFPTSLQFTCCQALRRFIPPHLDVLKVIDLPPGLRSFLQNKVSWLLQARVSPVKKNPIPTGKKRSCSDRSGCYEDEDRCKRCCAWEVCPLQGLS